jgi:DNA-nicking Smr family endonuclease
MFKQEDFLNPVKIPIEDVIDLHTFQPEEVPDLLSDYFTRLHGERIYSVRVIHGKVQGFLRRKVQKILNKNPIVESFKNAPAECRGMGRHSGGIEKKTTHDTWSSPSIGTVSTRTFAVPFS